MLIISKMLCKSGVAIHTHGQSFRNTCCDITPNVSIVFDILQPRPFLIPVSGYYVHYQAGSLSGGQLTLMCVQGCIIIVQCM